MPSLLPNYDIIIKINRKPHGPQPSDRGGNQDPGEKGCKVPRCEGSEGRDLGESKKSLFNSMMSHEMTQVIFGVIFKNFYKIAHIKLLNYKDVRRNHVLSNFLFYPEVSYETTQGR